MNPYREPGELIKDYDDIVHHSILCYDSTILIPINIIVMLVTIIVSILVDVFWVVSS